MCRICPILCFDFIVYDFIRFSVHYIIKYKIFLKKGWISIKVIFFDVDGVLNYCGTALIDDECLAQLKYIVAQTGANTVISSSWKEAFTKYDIYSDKDREMVTRLLKDPELKCLGWTPDIDEVNRENEVEEWLLEYDESEIESFVIIDDLDYDFDEKFPGHFVKTAGYWGKGLTEHHAQNAIRILGAL